ncbi:MAG: DNA primase [Synergistaceae bacterium]|nr:DNA primase [Synergistaceae bacterium]
MANEITDKIRSTLRIEDVIGRTVSLRRTHRGWSGLCPFHDDKAPSFHVYDDTQSYYCFACHESGDIFTFVMKTRNLTFPEAVSILAEEAGIDTRSLGTQGAEKIRTLHDVLNMSQEYFTSCMKRLPAGRAYLERRGIGPEIADAYGLGYVTDSWDGLIKFLSGKGVASRMMIDAGLVVDSEKGMYDRFRGRVMFPVRDVAGRIIAFGGRAIVPDVGAKYINSPESEIYRKRSNLYMLDAAGRFIRDKGYSILCEGYMDTLRLHMAGFRESVASLGTSLTDEQARLLKRFADRCCICYDGDPAGQKAALRGMYILAENGLDVRVVRLPEGKDPDDFLRENTPADFRKVLDDALPLIPYHIEMLRPELESPLKRGKALGELWEGVRRLKPDFALGWTASLAGAFMLPPEEMKRRILAGREIPETQKPALQSESVMINSGLECAFCAMLAKYRGCRLSVKPENISGLLTDDDAIHAAVSLVDGSPEELLGLWRTAGDTAKLGVIARGDILLSEMAGLDAAGKWEVVCSGLERLRIMRRLHEIDAKMKMNAATADDMRELRELQQKLQGLRI